MASWFQFLDGLNASMDQLHKAVWDGGFPDLEKLPNSDAEVSKLTLAASKWAGGVYYAYGIFTPEEIGYQYPGPRPLVNWFFARAQSSNDPIARVDRAADVLGELPREFHECRVLSMAIMCTENMTEGSRTAVCRPGKSNELIEKTVENWPTIRGDIEAVRLLTIAQVSQLLGWIRNRIDALAAALIPSVNWVEALPYNGVRVEVRIAGATRRVDLTNAEADLLRGMATKDQEKSLRRTKSELVKHIPELAMWISSSANPRSDRTENESTYRLAVDVRAHVCPTLPDKV